MLDKTKEVLALLEKYGLLNKIIEQVLTPEMAGAIARGFAKGLIEGSKK